MLFDQTVIPCANRFGDRGQFVHQRRAAGQAIKLGDIIERSRTWRQAVGLQIGNHLQAVLNRAQPVIAFAQQVGIVSTDQPGLRQRIQTGAGAAQPHRRMAAAVDQLVDLGKEFDLADAAAALLDIEPRSRPGGAGMVGTDPLGQPPDFGNRAKIEALAPDERADRDQERLACGHIPGARPGTDEGGALPRQGRAFVVSQRAAERDRQRGHLAGGAQPQVDPEDVAFVRHVAHQLDQLARHALRRFARFVAGAARQAFGIVEQDRVDVG